jgi:hypothetical protein
MCRMTSARRKRNEISVAEAAAIIGVSEQYVRRMASFGPHVLKARRLGKRPWLIDAADARWWRDERKLRKKDKRTPTKGAKRQ